MSPVPYLARTAVEVCLGLIKLRGRYQHESPGERSAKSAMYVRHHAASILSLAALSGLVQWRGLISVALLSRDIHASTHARTNHTVADSVAY